MSKPQEINRKVAAAFIEELLQHIAALEEGQVVPSESLKRLTPAQVLANEANRLRTIAASHGLQPPRKCSGEAHSNPFIDHCGVCMPHWGWTGGQVKVK